MRYLFIIAVLLISKHLSAQLPVKPLAPQSELLKSNDKKLAANKKLVYDMWREFLEGGNMEVAEKYFAEDYMQHNPNAATGRKAVVEFFSKFMKPAPFADAIKAQVLTIVAEHNLVMISFARELPDTADKTQNTPQGGLMGSE